MVVGSCYPQPDDAKSKKMKSYSLTIIFSKLRQDFKVLLEKDTLQYRAGQCYKSDIKTNVQIINKDSNA